MEGQIEEGNEKAYKVYIKLMHTQFSLFISKLIKILIIC